MPVMMIRGGDLDLVGGTSSGTFLPARSQMLGLEKNTYRCAEKGQSRGKGTVRIHLLSLT